jgi:amidophosphoribosyltransferase
VDTLFNVLVGNGQHPKEYSDSVTILENFGYYLDEENDVLVKKYKQEGYPRREISQMIAQNIDIISIIRNTCRNWDGGYVIAGLFGHGDAFVIRDPAGIRPAYYYHDDEVVVVTSERPPIQTAFNVKYEAVKELPPAHALIVKKDGSVKIEQYIEPLPQKSCSFERIYFSRGSDQDIYQERKMLGRGLVPAVLKTINNDVTNTVFSFIPNTAETCFYGMIDGLKEFCAQTQFKRLMESASWTEQALMQVLKFKPRVEKVAVKDAKLRTFITDDSQRNELAAHVYDITYGVIRPGIDTLVIIDDSIVRGTTMRESILKILDRTGPKKIIVLSSAPQIRYPDCYGIDMAKLGNFVAFEACVELLKENDMAQLLHNTYKEAKSMLKLPADEMTNCVQKLYKPFTADQISKKISELLRPEGLNAEVTFIFQTIEDLHCACPKHLGDWYFTGDYPTPGGNKVVNQSLVNYIEGNNERAY